jgi:acetyltransferase-like isoleucine patch superfamily enzyme
VSSLFKKALGVLGLYAPPPLNKFLAIYRGVKFVDSRTTWIGVRTFIDNEYPELIKIGANVTISFDVNIIAHTEPPLTVQQRYMPKTQDAVEIKDNVFIGARAIILPGVTINQWALVAAGSVVTRDVPEFAIVAGNPARYIGDIRDKVIQDKS